MADISVCTLTLQLCRTSTRPSYFELARGRLRFTLFIAKNRIQIPTKEAPKATVKLPLCCAVLIALKALLSIRAIRTCSELEVASLIMGSTVTHSHWSLLIFRTPTQVISAAIFIGCYPGRHLEARSQNCECDY
jgi:hypothetical protein